MIPVTDIGLMGTGTAIGGLVATMVFVLLPDCEHGGVTESAGRSLSAAVLVVVVVGVVTCGWKRNCRCGSAEGEGRCCGDCPSSSEVATGGPAR